MRKVLTNGDDYLVHYLWPLKDKLKSYENLHQKIE